MAIVYAIQNNLTNGIVYVGQTTNFKQRKVAHRHAAKNINSPSYNFPLYRAMRKYGVENFSFIVLKECDPEELNVIEKYFIEKYDTYYNGYNLTTGADFIGERSRIYSLEIIEGVYNDILNTTQSFETISRKHGISPALVSLINRGDQYYQSSASYPLRESQYNLMENDILEIQNLLKTSSLTMSAIGEKFNVPVTVISNINRGTRSQSPNIEYPIRKTQKLWTENELTELIDLLRHSKQSMKQIGKRFNVTEKTISAINVGRNKILVGRVDFPIRQKGLSPLDIKQIQTLLQESSISMKDLAQQFNCTYQTISYINSGKTHFNDSFLYPLRSYK